MYLARFSEDDYEKLISWVPNEAFNYLWGGPVYSFPLTIEQIHGHVSKPEVNPFVLLDNDNVIGYIELHRESVSVYRLCRVLIASESDRGKGYGKRLVALALDYALDTLKAKKVTLAVFEHNDRAISCYQSLGFTVTAKETGLRSFNGESWNLLYMAFKP
ncbi:GNAT family N-acetyltransferase [Photobacterium kasasachensis]|uniref:GNAT family N-acetyltransferase n=1 Tax=Photobacterium kasasachensis TaxID=2910240 RepID=UPI003D14E6B8